METIKHKVESTKTTDSRKEPQKLQILEFLDPE